MIYRTLTEIPADLHNPLSEPVPAGTEGLYSYRTGEFLAIDFGHLGTRLVHQDDVTSLLEAEIAAAAERQSRTVRCPCGRSTMKRAEARAFDCCKASGVLTRKQGWGRMSTWPPRKARPGSGRMRKAYYYCSMEREEPYEPCLSTEGKKYYVRKCDVIDKVPEGAILVLASRRTDGRIRKSIVNLPLTTAK